MVHEVKAGRWLSRLKRLVLVTTVITLVASSWHTSSAWAVGGGSIFGTVYNDTNGDGTLGGAETGIAGRTVFVDYNGDGVFQAGEPTTTTDANGGYELDDVIVGTWNMVTVQPSADWITTGPVVTANVTANGTLSNINLSSFKKGSIAGTVYVDYNGNGIHNAEDTGFAGIKVFIDANGNDAFDSGEVTMNTGSDGTFLFPNLGPGSYTIRFVKPAGQILTSNLPAAVVITSGANANSVDFGLYTYGSISGTVYEDASNDGVKDSTEPGHSNVVVYIDANSNGVLDSGESFTQTDGSGAFLFTGMSGGTKAVTVVAPAGYASTSTNPRYPSVTSGTTTSGVDFGISDSGVVKGMVFDDANGNGTKDPSEGASANRQVYLDINGNGLYTPGEPTATTDASGNYMMVDLDPATYKPRLVAPSDGSQTTPNPADINLTAGSVVTGVNFGVFVNGSITGSVYNDLNGNGVRDSGEPALANKVVYLDTNGSNSLNVGEPQTTTDASGNYSFANLAIGAYKVRVPASTGVDQTTVAPATVNVTSGSTSSGNDFGLFTKGSISGYVYNDINANGVKDSGENGILNRTVFLDKNDNGVQDSGEPYVVTDSSGNWTFSGLSAGQYRARLVGISTAMQTSALIARKQLQSGEVSVDNAFGSFTYGTINGTVYTDNNGNGTKDSTDNGQSGRQVYLDANNNGVLDSGEVTTTSGGTGVYSFTGLTYGIYKVRLVVPSPFVRTTSDPADVLIKSATASSGNNFGLYSPASLTGLVYDDSDGNASKGALEVGVSGVTVFIDTDGDGALSIGEQTVQTNSSGVYTFSNLGPGTYKVRMVIPAGRAQTTTNPAASTPLSGATTSGLNFGLFTTASIAGYVYNDVNGNGIMDVEDDGIAGRTLYLDLNASGNYTAGEPVAVTGADGSYGFQGLTVNTYRVRMIVPTGSQQTSTNPAALTPTSGSNTGNINFGSFTLGTLSGSVYSDINGNGLRETGETGQNLKTVFLDTNNNGTLNAGELSTTTDTSGNYSFSALGPGTYRPRVIIPGGNVQTSANPAPTVMMSNGLAAGNDFGLFTFATITGTVYNDANATAVKDTGELGVNKATVWLDTNNNGIFDTNEVSTTTASSGAFTFSGLGPGSYRVRAVLPTGVIQTTALASPVTTSSAATLAGTEIGQFTLGSVTGTVYSDTNGNGTLNSGESGLASRTVYIDTNNNGALDPGESTFTTASNGKYTFANLTYGPINIRLVPLSASVQTSPVLPTVTVISATLATGLDIGVFLTASISGSVYNDTNGNGKKDTGENPLGGVKVFLDTDGDGALDLTETSFTTDSTGVFTFSDLLVGSYRIRAVTPDGAVMTSALLANVTATSGAAIAGQYIGMFLLGSIDGVVYNDLTGNAAQDTDDKPLADVQVYIDSNGNNTYTANEPTATTDVNGKYSFTGLKFGTYKVRVTPPNGNVLTTTLSSGVAMTSGLRFHGADFGLFESGSISGTIYNDSLGNGVKEVSDQGVAKVTVFLDTNGNGTKDNGEPTAVTNSVGVYKFTSLFAGSYKIAAIVPQGYKQTSTALTPFVITSGKNVVTGDIGMQVTNPSATTTIKPGVTTTTSTTFAPVAPSQDPESQNQGYWMTNVAGDVYNYGAAVNFGSASTYLPTAPIVGLSPTTTGQGYNLVGSDGGIFSFGDAKFYGSMGGQALNKPMVGIANTPTGAGYWTVASDGGVFSYGDAKFYGSTGSIKLNQPIVQLLPTSSGRGYWMVATDGGIFAFGDAQFFGSTGNLRLNSPIVGMARSGDGGYWLAAADGGIFAFGTAQFYGSMGSKTLNYPITSITSTADGLGYWLFAADGGVFAFGSARYYGGTPATSTPIVN